ncbi:hypothetical protein, partial [Lacticaseibacillus rhamnosus]
FFVKNASYVLFMTIFIFTPKRDLLFDSNNIIPASRLRRKHFFKKSCLIDVAQSTGSLHVRYCGDLFFAASIAK